MTENPGHSAIRLGHTHSHPSQIYFAILGLKKRRTTSFNALKFHTFSFQGMDGHVRRPRSVQAQVLAWNDNMSAAVYLRSGLCWHKKSAIYWATVCTACRPFRLEAPPSSCALPRAGRGHFSANSCSLKLKHHFQCCQASLKPHHRPTHPKHTLP